MKAVAASLGAALFVGSEALALGVGLDSILFSANPGLFQAALWVVGAASVAGAVWAGVFTWKGEKRLTLDPAG